MNPNRQKGTLFETQVADYLTDCGIPTIRRSLGGTRDKGDLFAAGIPAVFECKNHRALDLADWVDQAQVEKYNAGEQMAFVIHKRKGTTQMGRQHVALTLDDLIRLLKKAYPHWSDEERGDN